MKRVPVKRLLLLSLLVVALVLALAGPALATINGGTHYSWDFSCSGKCAWAKCWGDYQSDGATASVVTGSGAGSSCVGYERTTSYYSGPDVALNLTCYRGVYCSCLGTAWLDAGIVLSKGERPIVYLRVGCGGPTP